MHMDENELLKKYNDLYLEIIMKYKGHIEEHESLYVAELPTLVTPNDELVKGLAASFSSRFQDYKYEDNFPDAAKLAFEHVKAAIVPVSLPIQFWLRPNQAIKYGAGDIFDKAVLLCSLLIALGNPSTKVIIVVRENERSFLVYFEFKERLVAMNLEDGSNEFGTKDEMLRSLNIDEKNDEITAYEFNDKMYIDLA
jgi:hypothetical protein